MTPKPSLTKPRKMFEEEYREDSVEGILTARIASIHDALMRTTVTLDPDVERLIREAMRRSRRGFKETLNAAIRSGLGPKPKRTKRISFVVRARPLGLRPGIDPASLNKVADELDVAAFTSSLEGKS